MNTQNYIHNAFATMCMCMCCCMMNTAKGSGYIVLR